MKTACLYHLPFSRYSPKEVTSFLKLGGSSVFASNLGRSPVSFRPWTTANQRRVSADSGEESSFGTFHAKFVSFPAQSCAIPFGGTV